MNAPLVDELSEWLAIPSVSADPAHAGDVQRAAEWLRDYVVRAGGTAELVPTERHPLVVGELPASHEPEAAPTVLLYGHFDVQPPAPVELWDSPPFEATVDGDWLVARGAVDDKGGLYMLARAATELAAEGALPVNVRLAADGEEEIGGPSIVDWVDADERGADVCLAFDGGMDRRGQPIFVTSARGVLAFELTVRTGTRDVHSGWGNALLNAVHVLAQALGALMPVDGRLPEPLRAGALPATDADRRAWALQKTPQEWLHELGARPYDERAVDEFFLRTAREPSFDINGIVGGKPGLINTTIPAEARANFTLRLAPGQDVETVAAAAERLLRGAAPDGAELQLDRQAAAEPAVVPDDEPAIRLALDAVERTFGRRPLLVAAGGTLPILAALSRRGIPAVLTGFGLSESNAHAPNERLLLEYLPLGVRTARELLTSFAALADD